MNVLDPDVKKGIWTAGEMKILRDSQKELGNKWSDIAKRIPGRSENSVKNRWYNQKTVSRKILGFSNERRKIVSLLLFQHSLTLELRGNVNWQLLSRQSPSAMPWSSII